jgi:hypothetical protein
MFSTLLIFGSAVNLKTGGGADGNGRNSAKSYIKRKGELLGLIKLVLLWHAIGHPVSAYNSTFCLSCLLSSKHDNPNISTDFIKTATQFSKATKLIEDLSYLSEGVNAAIKEIDPDQYEALLKMRKSAHKVNPFASSLSTIDPLVMEGRAIMYNRQTPLHPDSQDPFTAWAILVVLGKFDKGGYLSVPRLKLRIRFLPGDMIILRGRILPHEIEAWYGGQRVSIAHFTHQSLWDFYEIVCP